MLNWKGQKKIWMETNEKYMRVVNVRYLNDRGNRSGGIERFDR